jgi:hypothetical protein
MWTLKKTGQSPKGFLRQRHSRLRKPLGPTPRPSGWRGMASLPMCAAIHTRHVWRELRGGKAVAVTCWRFLWQAAYRDLKQDRLYDLYASTVCLCAAAFGARRWLGARHSSRRLQAQCHIGMLLCGFEVLWSVIV